MQREHHRHVGRQTDETQIEAAEIRLHHIHRNRGDLPHQNAHGDGGRAHLALEQNHQHAGEELRDAVVRGVDQREHQIRREQRHHDGHHQIDDDHDLGGELLLLLRHRRNQIARDDRADRKADACQHQETRQRSTRRHQTQQPTRQQTDGRCKEGLVGRCKLQVLADRVVRSQHQERVHQHVQRHHDLRAANGARALGREEILDRERHHVEAHRLEEDGAHREPQLGRVHVVAHLLAGRFEHIGDACMHGHGKTDDDDRHQHHDVLEDGDVRRGPHTRNGYVGERQRRGNQHQMQRREVPAQPLERSHQTRELQLPPWQQKQNRRARNDQLQRAAFVVALEQIGQGDRVEARTSFPDLRTQKIAERIGQQDVAEEPDAVGRPLGVDAARKAHHRADAVDLASGQKEHQPRAELPRSHEEVMHALRFATALARADGQVKRIENDAEKNE